MNSIKQIDERRLKREQEALEGEVKSLRSRLEGVISTEKKTIVFGLCTSRLRIVRLSWDCSRR